MHNVRSFGSMLLLLVSAALSMLLSSCSSASVSLDRRASAHDLANLYHATQGKQVVVAMLLEPPEPRRTYTAVEFALDLDSARFIDIRTNMRTSVPTAKIDYIECDSCRRSYASTGAVIGVGSGILIGTLIGASINAANELTAGLATGLSFGTRRYEPPPSAIPVSLLIGAIAGGGIGAASGAGASQPSTTWVLQD